MTHMCHMVSQLQSHYFEHVKLLQTLQWTFTCSGAFFKTNSEKYTPLINLLVTHLHVK